MKIKTIAVSAIAGCLALPALAQAHVTVQPEEVPAGGFTRLDVRVPNEQEDAATNRVEVQMPDGFLFVSYEPVPGWTGEVKTEKLDDPVEEHGEEITEQVDTVTFTADDSASAIQPGQFQDFGLSVGVPEEPAGTVLEFPAIQTYDNGDVVRWIQPPDSEEDPAATVTLGEPAAEHGAAEEDAEDAEEEATEAADEADDGGSDGLAIAALIVGALGVITGGTALARSRRNG